jgi:hypothetical protein
MQFGQKGSALCGTQAGYDVIAAANKIEGFGDGNVFCHISTSFLW